jgi:hypothetical protein
VLADVGREFGRELFELGIVNQTSPVSGTAKDRLAAAGLMYLLSGENIALATSVEAAHRELMDNPVYRANILNPGFTRVGISALRSAAQGLMVTQEFGSKIGVGMTWHADAGDISNWETEPGCGCKRKGRDASLGSE